jgi:hypothetical protein
VGGAVALLVVVVLTIFCWYRQKAKAADNGSELKSTVAAQNQSGSGIYSAAHLSSAQYDDVSAVGKPSQQQYDAPDDPLRF